MATTNLKILTCSRKQTTGPRLKINKNEAEKGLDKKWLFAKNHWKNVAILTKAGSVAVGSSTYISIV